jgi:hypothetical protein
VSAKKGSPKYSITFSVWQLAIFIVIFAAVGSYVVRMSSAAPHNNNGNGSNKSSGTISLIPPTTPDGQAHFGGNVNFTASTSATAYPWVQVQCSQNGTMVYTQVHGFFATAYDYNQPFQLGPTQSWTSGGASCIARLYNTNNGALSEVLASTTFNALP